MSICFQELRDWWEQPVSSISFSHWDVKVGEGEVSCLQHFLFSVPYFWKLTWLYFCFFLLLSTQITFFFCTSAKNWSVKGCMYCHWSWVWSTNCCRILSYSFAKKPHCLLLLMTFPDAANLFQLINKKQKFWNELYLSLSFWKAEQDKARSCFHKLGGLLTQFRFENLFMQSLIFQDFLFWL